VLKEGAPRLQAAQEAVKKEKLVHDLEIRVGQRPDRDELEKKNIIKAGRNLHFSNFFDGILFIHPSWYVLDILVAPALQAAQEALKKEKLAQGLAHKLEQRPEKDTLVGRNVLKGIDILMKLELLYNRV